MSGLYKKDVYASKGKGGAVKMKYKCEVGSFCTRMVVRQIIVHAQNEDDAREKAIDKYHDIESRIGASVDSGSPNVDSIEQI